jgi:3-hydroxybutyryl-CoA dehydrogenase
MRIGVVGGGLMGSGIAEVCARSGVDVTVVEVDAERLDRARSAIDRSLHRAVRSGKLAADDCSAATERIAYSSALEDLEGSDAAIEAIIEDEAAKRRLFSRLDEILPEAEFLASNTSSVPIMKLGAVTRRPERVLGLHFFNPVPVLPLVEVVRSIMTHEATLARAHEFAEQTLGKTTIDSQDRAGFVVNALLIPYVLSAIRMYESGFASKEDIDEGMVKGCAHPMGPLALADLIGLDTLLAVSESLYEEFRDPSSVAPPLLNRMVEAGLLGRKSGRGFYDYSDRG